MEPSIFAHHMNDVVISPLTEIELFELQLVHELLPLGPVHEGGGVHHAAIANHQAVVAAFLHKKVTFFLTNTVATYTYISMYLCR